MTLRGAVVDLDGTVYLGGELLPGAPAGIDELRAAGVDLLFFSNNPLRDGESYVEHLRELGLDVGDGEACSAGVATTEYLLREHAGDDVLLIGDEALEHQLRDAGLSLTDDPDRCDVLVASWTTAFDFEDMKTALRAVDDDTAFLGTDPDRTIPVADDEVIPGSGSIIGSVAAVVGRDPDAVLGKPSDVARGLALDRLGVSPDDCLVVGDRLDTDLALGDRAGMTTVLVLTGVTDRSDVAGSDVQPDYILDGLGDIDTVLAGSQ